MKQFADSKKLVKGLTPEEFKKLIFVIPPKDKIAKTCFLLGYGSGLRISEVTNLKKDDVKDNYISIWDSKGGKDRTVPKPKGWKEYMLSELPIKKSERTLQRKFKAYAKKAGLQKHYVFHSLRHGFGTRMVESGVPLNQLQLLMGHSSLSVTNVYTKARPQDALKSYEELF
jgi:integrase/recombinase XerC|tara:strand:- start:12978 stop:13490 length:513 start_codon:yes stop_codon:yes gene_type:complete